MESVRYLSWMLFLLLIFKQIIIRNKNIIYGSDMQT